MTTEFTSIKDSGKREDMPTGSRRDTDDGKPRFDLMPPMVRRRIGMHYANGIKKYGERNYELGQKTSRYMASLQRHLDSYMMGERDEDHLAALVWNACGIMLNEYMVEKGVYPNDLHDYTDYTSKKGWDMTIKTRAMIHNDMLRKKDRGVNELTGTELVEEACRQVDGLWRDSVPSCFGDVYHDKDFDCNQYCDHYNACFTDTMMQEEDTQDDLPMCFGDNGILPRQKDDCLNCNYAQECTDDFDISQKCQELTGDAHGCSGMVSDYDFDATYFTNPAEKTTP